MSTSLQPHSSGAAHESEIRSLSDQAGATDVEVRTLFVSEFARLKMGAKVSSYLTVLTTSSVRGMLRLKAARLAAAADGTPAQPAARF